MRSPKVGGRDGGGEEEEAAALEQGGLAEDVPVGGGFLGLAADGDEVEDAPVLAHDLLAEAVDLPPDGPCPLRRFLPVLDKVDPVRAHPFGEARARLVAAPKLLVGKLGHVPADGNSFARVDERGGLDEQPLDARAVGGGRLAGEIEGGLRGSVVAEWNQDGLHRLLHLGIGASISREPLPPTGPPGRESEPPRGRGPRSRGRLSMKSCFRTLPGRRPRFQGASSR